MTDLEQCVIPARARVDELRDALIAAEQEKAQAIHALVAERQQASKQTEYIPMEHDHAADEGGRAA